MPNDPDAKKGAVESDRPDQKTNVSEQGQNPHRNKGKILQGQDSDFPERGENEEHSMEGETQHSRFGGDPSQSDDPNVHDAGKLNDQDPGERQKRNQNDRREDPLAS